jgi:hypothetical protein
LPGHPFPPMTDNDMTDAFLKKHAPNLDTHQLALDLGSLGVQTCRRRRR